MPRREERVRDDLPNQTVISEPLFQATQSSGASQVLRKDRRSSHHMDNVVQIEPRNRNDVTPTKVHVVGHNNPLVLSEAEAKALHKLCRICRRTTHWYSLT